MNAPTNHISHDAAAGLLQIAPDVLVRLAGTGVVRRAAPGKYIPAQLIKDYIGHLHKEPDRRERVPTQAEVAEHLDMSDRNLRNVLALLGMDHKEVALSKLRVGYIRHLREVAAGRVGGEIGGLDLVQERAALAREQRLGIEIKNATARGDYAPIALLSEVLAIASQSVVERFEQLPAILKKSCPDLPDAAREVLMTALASARNEWVSATCDLVVKRLDDEADDATDGDLEPAE